MRTKGWPSIAGLALVLTACSEHSNDPLSAVSARSELHLGVPDITGTVLGPDGTAICNFVPEGSQITVRAIEINTLAFGGAADLICPDPTYVIPLAAGSYFLRAQFISTDGIGSFPWRTLTSSPIVVDVEDLTQDIRIDLGTALGGHATLDDQPVAGVAFGLVYQSLSGFGAAFGVSGADGGWADFFGRTPIVLQNDLDYAFATGCDALLGTVVAQGLPAGPFRFPGDLDAVNCALRSGATEPLTHNHNAVVVTAMPGDLGGLSPDIDPQFGQGFGVQFPAVPGAAPAHRPLSESQWFRGGLMVGLESGAILTGFDPAGELECGAACRDLGLDGKVSARSSPGRGKTVTWRYSDARSAEGVGLQIVQRSYDAPAGRPYVLFRFEVTNHSAEAQTLSLGVFADWDVDATIGDDVGFVERDGGLLSQSNADGPRTRVGTLLVGDAPPTAGFFYSTPFVPSLSDQAAALAGSLAQPAAGPADYRYIQSIAPLELRQGRSTQFWVAIVAGVDESEFSEAADAAFRDIQSRRRGRGNWGYDCVRLLCRASWIRPTLERVPRSELHTPAGRLEVTDVGIPGLESVDPALVRGVVAGQPQDRGATDAPPDCPLPVEKVQDVEEVGDQLDRLPPHRGEDLRQPCVHERDPRIPATVPGRSDLVPQRLRPVRIRVPLRRRGGAAKTRGLRPRLSPGVPLSRMVGRSYCAIPGLSSSFGRDEVVVALVDQHHRFWNNSQRLRVRSIPWS